MTAFEILLNKFYDTIENNQPKKNNESHPGLSFELNKTVKDFINTCFTNGNDLSFQSLINRMLEECAVLLRNSNYEEWARVKYVFRQNALHEINREHNFRDAENLKARLEQML